MAHDSAVATIGNDVIGNEVNGRLINPWE